ncbi:MAG: GTPase domain-containing protein [Gemmatimonadota bacterium]
MTRLNQERQELTATLVVFGAPRVGKSTILRCIHDRVTPSRLARQWPLGSPPSGIPLLDWLPLDLGRVGGWQTRVNLYGVPAERQAGATRRMVLADADGVLFVADSQAARLGENLEALRALQAQLLDRDGDVRELPLVMLYNKQDLPSEMILAPDVLGDALNFRGAPSFACDALRGVGVLEALHSVVTRMMRRLAPAVES